MIYVDNAATTNMSREAANIMIYYMTAIWGNPSSPYGFGIAAAEGIALAREQTAMCIGASAEEIYFTSGGSEADNQAIISVARSGKRKGKKHIISSKFEHHAVLHTLRKLKREGYEIDLLDVGENGLIRSSQVAEAIRKDTCLVTIMHANNEIGTIQPISEIGEICRTKGVIFHTDAVQTAGHIPIDVVEQKIDLLSVSAHKFHGPKGIGALYARKGIPLESIIEGGAQERGKRGGTENVPAIMGMATAMEEAFQNMEDNNEKVLQLRNQLIEGLLRIPGSIINGDLERRLPGNVNLCFEGIEGESLVLLLDEGGICASTGSACSSGSPDPSHVLLAIGRPREIANGSLRLSLSHYNTEEEIKQVIRSVSENVEYLRSSKRSKKY